MIYLEREKADFEKTKTEFEEQYCILLQRMFDTFKAKGETRDIGAPIHHRMSPATMVALAQAKMRRIETLISAADWKEDDNLRNKVVEECGDVANYVLYIAALCKMLQKEND